MMRKVICFLCCLILVSTTCLAQTVYFKNGRKVSGKIVERTDKHIRMDVGGVTLTYFSDEIERIEEEAAQTAATAGTYKPYLPTSQGPMRATPTTFQPYPSSRESQPPMSKRDLILTLITASGTKDSMNQTLTEIMAQASPEEAAQLRKIFNVDEIISEIVPVYEKYFTEGELRDLVDFYQSSAGRKLLMVTPLIMQETAEVSTVYLEKKLEGLGGQ